MPVIVENVLFQADDGEALARANWSGMTRLAARQLRAFCPVSLGLLQSIQNAFPRARAVHLPYGVDLVTWAPASATQRSKARVQLGVDNDCFVAVSFGTVHERKGQLPLIDAWLEWVETRKHYNCRLFIVGPQDHRAYKIAIEERMSRSPTAARATVVLAGYSRNVTVFLRAADVYMTAAVAEGLPISIVESLACGIPVICRHLHGVTEDFIHGQAVTGVKNWEATTVGNVLDGLFDRQSRLSASRDARYVAEQRFDITRRMATLRRLLIPNCENDFVNGSRQTL